jgi:hypothetical protein
MTLTDLKLWYKKDTGEFRPDEISFLPNQLDYVRWLEDRVIDYNKTLEMIADLNEKYMEDTE